MIKRNNVLTDFYMEGFRINFQHRMSFIWMDYRWSAAGTEFNEQNMVIENKYLYGDILTTTSRVVSNPCDREVVFAVSPIITKQTYTWSRVKAEVVHNATVRVGKKRVTEKMELTV
ncbi:hypothetical protein A1F99_048300 [Pyrenophora tritici-repentis]|nr:hypothetical protein A1F99_048300 [Pyrenophora tritici-repentis]